MNSINEAYWHGWHNGYKCAKDDYHYALVDYLVSNPDTVEVVRCKDCKYRDTGITEDGLGLFYKCLNGRSYGGTTLDSFCSWGERREDG